MIVSLIMVLLSGSRGALLATTVGGMVYFVMDGRQRARNVVVVGVLALVGQVALVSTETGHRAIASFQDRVLNLTIEKQHSAGRDDLYAVAYELGMEEPWFGHGLAGFTAISGRNYPHNIVLELFCETGICGVLLLFALCVCVCRFALRYRHCAEPGIVGAFGLCLTAAMFSGDFYDNRGIFLMAILASQNIDFMGASRAVSMRQGQMFPPARGTSLNHFRAGRRRALTGMRHRRCQ